MTSNWFLLGRRTQMVCSCLADVDMVSRNFVLYVPQTASHFFFFSFLLNCFFCPSLIFYVFKPTSPMLHLRKKSKQDKTTNNATRSQWCLNAVNLRKSRLVCKLTLKDFHVRCDSLLRCCKRLHWYRKRKKINKFSDLFINSLN